MKLILFLALSLFALPTFADVSTQVETSAVVVMEVSGMTCGSCAQIITKSIEKEKAKGVKNVKVNLKEKTVSVELEKGSTLGADDLKELVQSAGSYKVEKIR